MAGAARWKRCAFASGQRRSQAGVRAPPPRLRRRRNIVVTFVNKAVHNVTVLPAKRRFFNARAGRFRPPALLFLYTRARGVRPPRRQADRLASGLVVKRTGERKHWLRTARRRRATAARTEPRTSPSWRA